MNGSRAWILFYWKDERRKGYDTFDYAFGGLRTGVLLHLIGQWHWIPDKAVGMPTSQRWFACWDQYA